VLYIYKVTCLYFNNLNENDDMIGMSIMTIIRTETERIGTFSFHFHIQ